MSIKRVISPFTYYHEANRKIQTEESYPESDNPGLYMWNLKYQQLNKFPIPKAFIDRHNLHPTTRYLFENSKIEQSKSSTILSNNIAPCQPIKPTQQKLNKFHRKFPNSQQLLVKVLRQAPLEKLSLLFQKKNHFISTLTSNTKQLKKPYIRPKLYASLCNEVGNIIAMVDNHVKKRKPNQLQKSPSSVSPKSNSQKCNTSRKDLFAQPIEIIPIEMEEETTAPVMLPQSSSRGFKFRDAIHLQNKKNLSRPVPQDPVIQKAQESKDVQNQLRKRLRLNTQESTTQQDKKYFFNFKKYFYTNYGQQFQGVNSRISTNSQNRLTDFQTNLLKLINSNDQN